MQITISNKINFNPRSLAGATYLFPTVKAPATISIHAPLRERLSALAGHWSAKQFQSTLPCGSDGSTGTAGLSLFISIHAPLRERL